MKQISKAPMRLIDTEKVCELLGVKASHVGHLTRTDPTFPKPVKLGPAFNSAKRWPEDEVIAWMRSRLQARTSESIAAASKRGVELAKKMRAKLRTRSTSQAA